MKRIINQKGMTLVVVLLMITVFSILGLSIMSFAISNTKQIEKSEQEVQAVDLAEMGVVFYKNLFITKAAAVLKDVNQDINRRISNGELTTQAEIINAFYQELDTRRGSFILPLTYPYKKTIMSESNRSYSYKINQPATPVLNNKALTLKFTSIGRAEQSKEENITITMILDVNALMGFGGGSGSGEWDGTIPPKPPELTEVCTSSNLNNDCYYKGDLIDITLGNKDDKSPLYYLEGNATFLDISGGIKDATLYIDGRASFTTVNGIIQNSKLYIGGNLIFTNVAHGGIKDAEIYVGGDLISLTINGNDITGNSKVCVRGEVPLSLRNNSSVYSLKYNETAYNANCPPIAGSGTTVPTDIESKISAQLDNLDIQYDYELN